MGLALPSVAAAPPDPPIPPDPNFAVDLLPRPCALEGNDPYERQFYENEGWTGPDYERYPGACSRLRFSYGPIAVKPGQNDVLVGPITVEKPSRNGYITRIEPNLVRADGSVPPVEQVHLHHGTWLAVPEYGSGPFFASGEEKTIAPFPRGYGLPVKATDQWNLLYMVHSAIQQPLEVYITYDIDFVPEDKGKELGLTSAYPLWLDVRPSGYPVFNSQRQFGGDDGVCTWPKEKCAEFDPWGKLIVGQGKPGNEKGQDYTLPDKGESFGRIDSFEGGTILGLGGHLHPGGLQNEVDLVRPGREPTVLRYPATKRRKPARKRRSGNKRRTGRRSVAAAKRKRARRCRTGRKRATTGKRRARRRCRARRGKTEVVRDSVRIYTGQPVYWDWEDPSKPGGPPNSWDHSATVLGNPYWGVHVKPGDILRSNATYDTKIQSTYENMGIVVGLLVPDKADGSPGAPGVDPFTTLKDTSKGCKSGGLKATPQRLCDKGFVTHGHMVGERKPRRGRRDLERPHGLAHGRRERRDRRLPLRARRLQHALDVRRAHRAPRLQRALHERRRRHDLPHRDLLRLPLPRPDQCVLPAGGREDEPGPRRRVRFVPARHWAPVHRAGQERAELGPAGHGGAGLQGG